MKKTYINPALKVVKVQPSHLLTLSNESMGMQGNLNGDVTIGARSARFSDNWDEWDEE